MIRMTIIGMLALLLTTQKAAGQRTTVVIPARENVGVYRNEIRKLFETPLFSVGTCERLQVITEHTRHLKIRDRLGREGWVDKGMCAVVAGSRLYEFDPALVEQYMDAKSPVIILDVDDPENAGIRLDRSFRDALGENADRETIDRVCSR